MVDPGERHGGEEFVMVKDPVETQREFYAPRPHDHLQPADLQAVGLAVLPFLVVGARAPRHAFGGDG